MQWKNKKKIPASGTKEEFDKIKEQFEDLLTEIRGFEDSEEVDLADDYYFILSDYNDLIKKAKSDFYSVEGLQEAYNELKDFYEEHCSSQKSVTLYPSP
nr:hypothetical protein [Legionella norrlandica]